MKKCFLILFFVFLPSICFAAIINGPANLREKPNGKTTFILENNVFVREVKKEGDWYLVEFEAEVSKKDYNKKPFENIVAKNEKGETVGKFIQYEPQTLDAAKNDRVIIFLNGYTHKNNIIVDSTLESKINKILDNQVPISKNAFYKIFDDWESDNSVHEYEAEPKLNATEQKMAEGYKVLDVGPDFSRRAIEGAPRANYQMERTITKSYEGYEKVFTRTGKDSLTLPE